MRFQDLSASAFGSGLPVSQGGLVHLLIRPLVPLFQLRGACSWPGPRWLHRGQRWQGSTATTTGSRGARGHVLRRRTQPFPALQGGSCVLGVRDLRWGISLSGRDAFTADRSGCTEVSECCWELGIPGEPPACAKGTGDSVRCHGFLSLCARAWWAGPLPSSSSRGEAALSSRHFCCEGGVRSGPRLFTWAAQVG